jgi:hypothetical protein
VKQPAQGFSRGNVHDNSRCGRAGFQGSREGRTFPRNLLQTGDTFVTRPGERSGNLLQDPTVGGFPARAPGSEASGLPSPGGHGEKLALVPQGVRAPVCFWGPGSFVPRCLLCHCRHADDRFEPCPTVTILWN